MTAPRRERMAAVPAGQPDLRRQVGPRRQIPAAPRPAGTVPSPPVGVTGPAAVAWVELWRCPVSVIWGPSDFGAVARLCQLRLALAETPGSPGLHASASRLEDTLGLSPRGRVSLGVEIADEPVARPGPSRVAELGGVIALD